MAVDDDVDEQLGRGCGRAISDESMLRGAFSSVCGLSDWIPSDPMLYETIDRTVCWNSSLGNFSDSRTG